MAGGSPSRYVYVIRLESGEYKIGQSNNVGARFYKMFFGGGAKLSSNPPLGHQPSRIVITVDCGDEDTGQKTERFALSFLSRKYDTNGETFPCTEDEAVLAVRLARELAS